MKITTCCISIMASAKKLTGCRLSLWCHKSRHLMCVKSKISIICLALLATCFCLLIFLSQLYKIHKVGQYTKWIPDSLPPPFPNYKYYKYFVRSRDQELYMYSATANYHQPQSGSIGVVITTLDGSRGALDCCVLLDGSRLYTTRAEEYFFYHTIDVAFLARIDEFFTTGYLRARQYLCPVPEIGQAPSHATLKSASSPCSTDLADYVKVYIPPQVPGGLAVCGKVAYGGGLDPEVVIEWFEVQRILGVDKVLLFDLGNPENLTRVFKYYQDLGFLDLQPYELPGDPVTRTFLDKDKGSPQFHHDETMAVLECRQRMSGYTYVMSHDLDEFIIPRRDIDLKSFFKEQMEYYQDSAGFYFDAEFFIYNWGPTNPEDDLMLTRNRKATKPHWECTKYVYLPTRVISSTTHSIYPLSPFTTYRISSEEAVIHHYRRCPTNVWKTCFPETIIDGVMTRYTDLHSRVQKVRSATKIHPTWTNS